MLKNSNVLLIPHAAAITERNVTQRYLALWTPRLLSVGLIRCKRGWSHRLTLLWTREERELAHLNPYRLDQSIIPTDKMDLSWFVFPQKRYALSRDRRGKASPKACTGAIGLCATPLRCLSALPEVFEKAERKIAREDFFFVEVT
jgi:hypothetical protein